MTLVFDETGKVLTDDEVAMQIESKVKQSTLERSIANESTTDASDLDTISAFEQITKEERI